MKLKPPLVVAAAILISAGIAGAQTKESSSPSGPPKFLSMVHQELKPGSDGAYATAVEAVANSYTRENIPVYWVGLESITGPPEALSISLFASSGEMQKSAETLDNALRAHPELQQMQDRLLQENTSGAETILAVRRDDMGFRVNTIDLAKMRYLRVSTIYVHPGYERAFMQAEWMLSGADEKMNAQTPWVVYEVNTGLPAPTFIVLSPMRSLADLDQGIDTDAALQKPENEAVRERIEELARVAYGNVETYLFRVLQKSSHISKDFAASDPQFWSAAPAGEPDGGATKAIKPATRKVAPKQ